MFEYPERARFGRILPKKQDLWLRPAAPRRAAALCQPGGTGRLAIQTCPGDHQSPRPRSREGDSGLCSDAANPELPEEVLRTMDRAIPSLVFFELLHDAKLRFAAAFKRPGENDPLKPVVDAYFQTPWQDAAAPRRPLPAALDLESLYRQMLVARYGGQPVGPAAPPGRDSGGEVARGNRIRAKLKECRRLEAILLKERQFNRKVELNAALRQRRAELAVLGSASAASV